MRHLDTLSTEARDLGPGFIQGGGYDIRLTFAPDGSITFHDRTGGSLVFAQSAQDGTYAPTGAAPTTRWSPRMAATRSSTLVRSTRSPRPALQRFTAGDGTVLRYEYTSANGQTRLSAIIDPTDAASRISCDGTGSIIEIDDPASNHFSYGYDSQHRLTTFRSGYGNSTTYSYDAGGRVSTIVDDGGNSVAFVYDAQGRVTSVTVTDGGAPSTTTFAYGPAAGQCDPASAAGRTTATASDGSAQDYCYNAAGEITATSPALGGQQYDSPDTDEDGACSLGEDAGIAGTDDSTPCSIDSVGSETERGPSTRAHREVSCPPPSSVTTRLKGRGPVVVYVNAAGGQATDTPSRVIACSTDRLARTTLGLAYRELSPNINHQVSSITIRGRIVGYFFQTLFDYEPERNAANYQVVDLRTHRLTACLPSTSDRPSANDERLPSPRGALAAILGTRVITYDAHGMHTVGHGLPGRLHGLSVTSTRVRWLHGRNHHSARIAGPPRRTPDCPGADVGRVRPR